MFEFGDEQKKILREIDKDLTDREKHIINTLVNNWFCSGHMDVLCNYSRDYGIQLSILNKAHEKITSFVCTHVNSHITLQELKTKEE
jgi:hypothetical protein